MQKTFISAFIGLGLSLASINAFALADIYISNDTDFPSTAKINGSLCSASMPGGVGVTHPHQTNKIPGNAVNTVCRMTKIGASVCEVAIHLDARCSDDSNIGTASVDLDSGAITAQITDANYEITIDGTHITLRKATV